MSDENAPVTGANVAPRIDGLDFSDLDHTSAAEREAFRAGTEGFSPIGQTGGHAGLGWWLDQDSDFAASVLKRYRLFCHTTINDHALSRSGSYLALYALLDYTSGLGYLLRGYTRRLTRQQAFEVIAVAFQWCGPAGMERIAAVWKTLEWPDAPPESARWPDGWAPDPAAFDAGLDYGQPDLSAEEAERLERWYLHYEGEVPAYARLLLATRPRILKDHRNRFEHLVRDLPKQVLPISQLHFAVQTRAAAGIRENVLLARGFGVSKEFLVTTIHNALVYGGAAAASLVESEAGDVIRAWP